MSSAETGRADRLREACLSSRISLKQLLLRLQAQQHAERSSHEPIVDSEGSNPEEWESYRDEEDPVNMSP